MAELYIVPSLVGSSNQPVITYTGPVLELQTGPTDFIRLLEIILFENTSAVNATSGVMSIGIGVPGAKGIGVSAVTPLYADGGNTNSLPGLSVFTYWNVPPSTPSTFLRKQNFLINTGGAFRPPISFRFPRGFKMNPSTSIVLWATDAPGAVNGGAAFDPYIVVDA